MKIIKKLLKYREAHIQYLIGYSQVALKEDNKLLWMSCEFVRTFQVIGTLLLLWKYPREAISNKSLMENVVILNELQSLGQLVVAPSIILELLDTSYWVYYQVISLLLLIWTLFMNIISMRIEYLEFLSSNLQIKKLFQKMEGNKYCNVFNPIILESINILNNTYNNNNFVEHVLLKQLMRVSGESWIDFQLKYIAYFSNYFLQIFLIPYVYQIMLIFYMLQFRTMDDGKHYAMLIINLLTIPFLFAVSIISIDMQQSYRLNDSNNFRLTVSNYFILNQFIKILPPIIYFLALIFSNMETIVSSFNLLYVIGSISAISEIIDIYDYFTYLPFVSEYKMRFFNFTISLSFTFTFNLVFQLQRSTCVTYTLFFVPCSWKMLEILKDELFNKILQQTLHCETSINVKKQQSKKNSLYSNSKSIMTENIHQIEQNVYKQRNDRLTMIKNEDYQYFPQFVKLFQQLHIHEQQVLQTNEQIDYKKSKFLIRCVILVRSHLVNCTNIYCYCRGLRGEKRTIMERNTNSLQMKIYNDFVCDGILISVDLITRFINSYIKLIINLLTFVSQPDLTLISQLLVPLSESEESFQTWLIVMELKMQLKELNKPYDKTTLSLIISYGKYQTLYQSQFDIKDSDVKKTIVYEDFRTSERKRIELGQRLFTLAEDKKRFLLQLLDLNITHESLQNLFIKNVKIFNKVNHELMKFFDSFQCKTSIMLLMFFYLELKCDYMSFIKFQNLLKTKETKFFEYPPNSTFYQKVCFLKLNLSRFSKSKERGEIISKSENAPLFFGYQKDEFQAITTVHQLVSPLISYIHNTIIELFLMSNKPNVLRRERYLLAQKKDFEIVYVEIFLDLCFQMTDSEFPIYCFLNEVKPIGRFENIRGHFLIDEYNIITGVSKLAYQSLLLNDYDSLIDKEMMIFMPNFLALVHPLLQQLDYFLNNEKIRLKQNSEQKSFNTTTPSYIYNRFQIHHADQSFILTQRDRFLIDIQITLIYGIIDGTESKFFVFELNKVQQEDEDQYFTDSDPSAISEEKRQNDLPIQLPTHYGTVQETDNFVEKIVLNTIPYESQEFIQYSSNNQLQLQKQSSYRQLMSSQMMQQKRQSQFFSNASRLRSDSEFQDQSSLIISTTNVKQSNEFQRIIIKATQYHEFTNDPTTSVSIRYIQIINLLILIIIFAFLMIYQLRFRNETSNIIPTIQILQAFITTDYTDNLQLALIYHKQDVNYTTIDPEMSEVKRLLEKDAQMYINYQKEYLLSNQIKEVFSDHYQLINNTNVSCWQTVFDILYYQQQYLNPNNLTRHYYNYSFTALINSFPTHKQTYGEINLEFTSIVQESIKQFSIDYQIIIYIFLGFVIATALLTYLVYYNYFQLLKKYSRCCEQVRLEQIYNEIDKCEILIQMKKLQLYDYKYEIIPNNMQKSTSRSQIDLKNQKNPHKYSQKQIKIIDTLSFQRHIYFLIPLTSIFICLIFFIVTYEEITLLMNNLLLDINYYNQGILFQQSFSLTCFSSIILENQEFLITRDYIQESQLLTYLEYADYAITDSLDLSRQIRLPSQDRSIQIIKQLDSNICEILTDSQDQSICETINDGSLVYGILKNSQYYINNYRNNLVVNYDQNYIVPTKSADVIAINFIIKAITNYVSDSRTALEKYINEQIDINFLTFILAFLFCLFLQLLIIVRVSRVFEIYQQMMKEMIYLLPRETLYQEDSFMKTLMYVQRTQNNCIQ